MPRAAPVLAMLFAGLAIWPAGPLKANAPSTRQAMVADLTAAEHRFARGLWSREDFDRTWGAVGTVPEAISVAAQATSIDYEFLLAQAYLESAMNPGARARTSSATGLFQFINSTWLSTVQRHGARFGLDDWAQQIGSAPGGGVFMPDGASRQQLLELRTDPLVASVMAAGLAEDNRHALEAVLQRAPNYTELYLAHFLGARGATRFVTLLQYDPSVSASSHFPEAARANRAIFFERDGSARSLAGVMRLFDGKIAHALDQVRHHVAADRYRAATVQLVARHSERKPEPAPVTARPKGYLEVDDAIFAQVNGATLVTGGLTGG